MGLLLWAWSSGLDLTGSAHWFADRRAPPPSDGLSAPRSVTKLLEDLVYFVTGGTNSGQDVLEVVFSKPNRERQKLMREQNILKQVGALWPRAALRGVSGVADREGQGGSTWEAR